MTSHTAPNRNPPTPVPPPTPAGTPVRAQIRPRGTCRPGLRKNTSLLLHEQLLPPVVGVPPNHVSDHDIPPPVKETRRLLEKYDKDPSAKFTASELVGMAGFRSFQNDIIRKRIALQQRFEHELRDLPRTREARRNFRTKRESSQSQHVREKSTSDRSSAE